VHEPAFVGTSGTRRYRDSWTLAARLVTLKARNSLTQKLNLLTGTGLWITRAGPLFRSCCCKANRLGYMKCEALSGAANRAVRRVMDA
jgi:hypothetical protein